MTGLLTNLLVVAKYLVRLKGDKFKRRTDTELDKKIRISKFR